MAFKHKYSYDEKEKIFTDRLLPEIEQLQQRLLATIYPIIYIDAVHFSVRDNNVIKKVAAYIILGIHEDGKKRGIIDSSW